MNFCHTFVHSCPYFKDISFSGEEHWHRDVQMTFCPGHISTLAIINNLCSLRLWKSSLVSIRLRHLKNLTFHFHCRAHTLNECRCQASTTLFSPTPRYDTLGRMPKPESKNRTQRGISNMTTRLSLKPSREHDKKPDEEGNRVSALSKYPHVTGC